MRIIFIRRSLGHKNGKKKDEMILTVWREKELEQGIKHQKSRQFRRSGSVEKMFSFHNLRCADKRNRFVLIKLEKIVLKYVF